LAAAQKLQELHLIILELFEGSHYCERRYHESRYSKHLLITYPPQAIAAVVTCYLLLKLSQFNAHWRQSHNIV